MLNRGTKPGHARPARRWPATTEPDHEIRTGPLGRPAPAAPTQTNRAVCLEIATAPIGDRHREAAAGRGYHLHRIGDRRPRKCVRFEETALPPLLPQPSGLSRSAQFDRAAPGGRHETGRRPDGRPTRACRHVSPPVARYTPPLPADIPGRFLVVSCRGLPGPTEHDGSPP